MPNSQSKLDAYRDGIHAAWRIEKYVGATTVPECPYREETPEYDEWWLGFGHGTDDMMYQKELEYTEEDPT